ncbi:CDPK-related kinase 5-like [Panicum miliaceum]|uniref:CDPK-related kinase 5-like n=1 Tax=Panicum miliaceum TaxID=4540 RepID=A0A3L6TF55_PANMI|nr:CDPK-related kinase 5-like [Panicum miliaceum]
MGGCHAKPLTHDADTSPPRAAPATPPPGCATPATPGKKHWAVSPFFPFSTPSPSPAHHLFGGSAASPRKSSPARPGAAAGSAPTTPARRLLRLPFPPPSPAKHIRAALARRHGPPRPSIPEEVGGEGEGCGGCRGLDKGFGFNKGFAAKYDMGDEVGRGHFGYTCAATVKKGARKGESFAVKVIPKAKMTTSIAIEDVRREVKILKALAGNKNLVQFYDAYEDNENVYIVMELCEGGELLDRILSRGGKYSEDDAKAVLVQILNVVAFVTFKEWFIEISSRSANIMILLSVVWNLAISVALNFLFTSKDENAHLKAIDFGLSDFVKPDERLNDIVGSAYYIAPEVLHRCYSTEADVIHGSEITMTLNCHWTFLYSDLSKLILFLIFTESCSEGQLYRRLTVDELFYLKAQFSLLEPDRNGCITLDNIRMALTREATDAMKESRVQEILVSLSVLQYRRMDFQEFCAAAVSVHQLEALDRWEQHARSAYDHFEKDGNRAIVIDELASELGLSPSVPLHVVLQDWIRHTDGKLSFLGFVKLLHGMSSRSL